MKIDGLRVVDAKKPVVIVVNTRDTAKGSLKDPYRCPAALSCMRELEANDARIHAGVSYVRYNGKWTRYATSRALRQEIVSFDRGGKFMPGEYVLLKPHAHIQIGNKRHRPNGKATGTRKRRTLRGGYTQGIRPIALLGTKYKD